MATLRPRITVTVTDQIMDVLKRYSDVSGETVSNIVFQILESSVPAFEVGINIVSTAKALEDETKKALISSLQPEIEHVQKFTFDTMERLRRPSQVPPSVCAGEDAGEGGAEGVNPLAINKGVRLVKQGEKRSKTHKTDQKKGVPVWLASSQGGDK